MTKEDRVPDRDVVGEPASKATGTHPRGLLRLDRALDDACARSQDAGNTITGGVSGQVVQAQLARDIHIHNATSRVAVPHELPPPSWVFTNRQRELAELADWHATQTARAPLVVCHGASGVGKTALALHWLYAHRHDFPDGQIYVDLGGFSASEPVTAYEALEWVLRSLGMATDQVPANLPRRQALFRSLVADRALAILLDDAIYPAQVRPLVPAGSRSTVMVTGRVRLAGLAMDGARFVGVEPFATDEALELLGSLVTEPRLSAEHQAVRELAELCGGLPLALSLVGARLTTRPNRSVAREAAELRAEHRRLAALSVGEESSIVAVFDHTYRRLLPAVARAYRLCALHPGRWLRLEVAAAALDEPADRAEELLYTLTTEHTLTELDDLRYRFHDLVRLHARQQADADEPAESVTAAVRRMIEWYLDTTVAADLLVNPARRRVGPRYAVPQSRPELFASDRDALAWLENERPNLYAALAVAGERGWDDLVWQFCEALWGLFLHRRQYAEWIDIHEHGIAAAQRQADPVAEAKLRSQLGFAYAELGDYPEVINQNTVAMELGRAAGHKPTEAGAISRLGRAARAVGDRDTALSYYRTARDLFADLGQDRGVALSRRRIGEILSELHRYDEAIDELRAAAQTMWRLGDRTQHAQATMYLGQLYGRLGRPDAAAEILDAALTAMRDLGSPFYQAQILVALGENAERAGDLAGARAHFAAARDRYAEVGDPHAGQLQHRLDELPPD